MTTHPKLQVAYFALFGSILLILVVGATSESRCQTIEARFNGQAPYKNKGDRLYINDKLYVNEVLISKNKLHLVHMQSDGNLVRYDRDGHARWSTQTDGKTVSAFEMQRDGRLILWKDVGNMSSSPWYFSFEADCVSENSNCVLIMQDDGNLVAYKGSQPIFSAWHPNAALTVRQKREIREGKAIFSARLPPANADLTGRRKRAAFALLNSIVGFAATIFTIYDSISAKTKEDPLKNLPSEMIQVQTILLDHSNKLKSLEGVIKLEALKTSLFNSERGIRNCVRAIGKLTEYETNKDFREDVVKNCQDLENNLHAIADSINGYSGVAGSDLLEVVYNHTGGRPMKFLEKVNPVQQLMAVGAGMAPIYFKLVQSSPEKMKSFEDWLRQEDMKIRCRMKFDYEPKIVSESRVPAELERFLKENRRDETKNQELATVIHSYLKDQWDHKKWFVSVFDYTGFQESLYSNLHWMRIKRNAYVTHNNFHLAFWDGKHVLATGIADSSHLWTDDEANRIKRELVDTCEKWKWEAWDFKLFYWDRREGSKCVTFYNNDGYGYNNMKREHSPAVWNILNERLNKPDLVNYWTSLAVVPSNYGEIEYMADFPFVLISRKDTIISDEIMFLIRWGLVGLQEFSIIVVPRS